MQTWACSSFRKQIGTVLGDFFRIIVLEKYLNILIELF